MFEEQDVSRFLIELDPTSWMLHKELARIWLIAHLTIKRSIAA